MTEVTEFGKTILGIVNEKPTITEKEIATELGKPVLAIKNGLKSLITNGLILEDNNFGLEITAQGQAEMGLTEDLNMQNIPVDKTQILEETPPGIIVPEEKFEPITPEEFFDQKPQPEVPEIQSEVKVPEPIPEPVVETPKPKRITIVDAIEQSFPKEGEYSADAIVALIKETYSSLAGTSNSSIKLVLKELSRKQGRSPHINKRAFLKCNPETKLYSIA